MRASAVASCSSGMAEMALSRASMDSYCTTIACFCPGVSCRMSCAGQMRQCGDASGTSPHEWAVARSRRAGGSSGWSHGSGDQSRSSCRMPSRGSDAQQVRWLTGSSQAWSCWRQATNQLALSQVLGHVRRRRAPAAHHLCHGAHVQRRVIAPHPVDGLRSRGPLPGYRHVSDVAVLP